MAMGRPSSYSPELAARICDLIVETGSLREACKADDLPTERTVYRWLAVNEDFRHMYAHAREVATEADNEEMRRIAYDEDIKADDKRVIVDVLKWQMARRAPKKWGDRMTLSNDPEQPFGKASDDALEAKFQALLDKARGSADADSAA